MVSRIDLKHSKVLVTGGAGFLGSNIVHALEQAGAQITVMDNLSTGRLEHLPISAKIEFVEGDVTDRYLVEDLISEHRLVIHAAAVSIIASTQDPMADFRCNVEGTLNVLLAAKKCGVTKIVYTGTSSVYGNQNSLPITEDSPTCTLSPYAVSKLAAENYCYVFNEMFGVPSSVVRHSNVYGFNQDPRNPYCGVVAKFFKSAMNDQPIEINGDGEQTRDFTFVQDASKATIETLVNPEAVGKIFNVSSGKETSINRLAKLIIEISASNSEVSYVDRRDIDNIRRRVLNIEQIRDRLGWKPQFGIQSGLQATFTWLQNEETKNTLAVPD